MKEDIDKAKEIMTHKFAVRATLPETLDALREQNIKSRILDILLKEHTDGYSAEQQCSALFGLIDEIAEQIENRLEIKYNTQP